MARNSEMTRQWQVLRDIDAARTGITIPKLAAAREVHQRTIRRDLDALSGAGFPLYDEKVNGSTMWKLRARPFRGLEEMGLSVMELCALYFSRALLASLAGAPFQDDAERALAKIERGHSTDMLDVSQMIERGLVEPSRLLEFFSLIEDQMYKYPAVDGKSFREAVERLTGFQN